MNRNGVASIICCLTLSGCGGFGPGLTDFSANFGNGCELIQFSAQDIRITVGGSSHENRCVPAKVVACGFDAKFVVAKQQRLDAKGNPIRGAYRYWIVEAPLKKRHGPFTEQEFAAQRKALGVPESIELRGARSYRP